MKLLLLFFALIFHSQFSQASTIFDPPIQLQERESTQVTDVISTTIKDLTYCKAGAIDLHMDAYLPAFHAKTPSPVLIYIHGGAWIAGDKDESTLRADLPELLKRGYAVFSINYRLAPVFRFPAQIEDCKCAVRSIRANGKNYNIDPTRIGVWGSSAGGHLATLLGVTEGSSEFEGSGGYSDQSSAVQAVATYFGPADITSSDWSLIDKVGFLSVFGASKYWAKASSVQYVTKQAPPFLVLVGDKDKIVDAKQGDYLFSQLKANKVKADLLVMKNCGHEFHSWGRTMFPSRPEVTKKLGVFFDQHIKRQDPNSYAHTRPRRVFNETPGRAATKPENSRE